MSGPFGSLPEPQPRFRRPVLSAGRRKLGRSLVHMGFLLSWFVVMLVFTPAGGFLVSFFESQEPALPVADPLAPLRQARAHLARGEYAQAEQSLRGARQNAHVTQALAHAYLGQSRWDELSQLCGRDHTLWPALTHAQLTHWRQHPSARGWHELQLMARFRPDFRPQVEAAGHVYLRTHPHGTLRSQVVASLKHR